ncbi:Oxidation resistance protein 1 [Daldinia childiae]|uniref:Oxidation resistance protein 1 n=1 Tax=Daldinia childiae TaxID=326645 RepID=UPI0014474743|nr:Oxidation resistance protein 1 [Daldinia childiae]KAF3066331.1 Oxidation resistance protein 1 [Daldinia childiae]
MSINRQDTDLIDLSPISSGPSTPISRHHHQSHTNTHTHTFPESKPQSPPPQGPSSSGSGYGIIFGLWRRFSSLESPTSSPLSHSQLYNANSEPVGAGDGITGPFIPPTRRTPSPLRGLPSLEPLVLHGYRTDTRTDERLLAHGLAEEIRTFLPERLKIIEDWRLVYSLYQDGSSLATLYKRCEEYRGRRVGFVLVIRDGREGTFGAYLTEAPHPAPSYFGTGECFLWRASLHAPLPPPPSADTSNMNFRTTTIASPTATTNTNTSTTNADFPSVDRQPASQLAPAPTDLETGKAAASASVQSIRFQNFAYTGANDYCIFCETGFLSVGGGRGGTYGLWLDNGLTRGHSAPCDTFLNQPLSDEGEKFDVFGVEMWVDGESMKYRDNFGKCLYEQQGNGKLVVVWCSMMRYTDERAKPGQAGMEKGLEIPSR